MRIIPPQQTPQKHGCKPALNLSFGSFLFILLVDFSILSSGLIMTMHDNQLTPDPFSYSMSNTEHFKENLQPAIERRSSFFASEIDQNHKVGTAAADKARMVSEGHKYTQYLLNCYKIRKHPYHVINVLMGNDRGMLYKIILATGWIPLSR